MRVGAAAYCSARALSTWKSRSGMGTTLGARRTALQVGEERIDGLPDVAAAGEAAPLGADDADKAIAFVDRDDVAVAAGADVIDDEGFDVGLHVAEELAAGSELLPR